MRIWLLACLLVACSEPPEPPRKTTSAVATQQSLDHPADSRSYPVRGSELIVVDVPVAGTSKRIEFHKCFVFRDSEFRTASISCPADAIDLSPADGATADAHNP